MFNNVAIIGFGAVGKSLGNLFPGAIVHDPPAGIEARDAANACRVAFVCVPTPALPDGRCDTSLVEETVAWLGAEFIVIRSTVPPGTTATLAQRYRKRVIFQPEYGPGSTPGHPFAEARDIPWVILGGKREWTNAVADLYKRVFNSHLVIQQTDAVTAELTKYMENAFLATKVAFCNEFYEIAEGLGVDYNELRELWLLDPRIGRSHTWVHPGERGFGGDCLPKDLDALLAFAAEHGVPQPILLDAVRRSNARVRAGDTPS